MTGLPVYSDGPSIHYSALCTENTQHIAPRHLPRITISQHYKLINLTSTMNQLPYACYGPRYTICSSCSVEALSLLREIEE